MRADLSVRQLLLRDLDRSKERDHIKIVHLKIKIDGKTDEVAWDKAQVIDNFQVFWQNRKPLTSTKARLDERYDTLARQFARLDQYAAKMQQQGDYLSNIITSLNNTQTNTQNN